MDKVLDQLGGLLLTALPTFLLLYIIHYFLRWAFYKPMDNVLRQRWEATEGARKAADDSLAKAERKAAEYEEALRQARAELLREQEAARARLQQTHASALAEARREAEELLKKARAGLAAEAETARKGLEQESEALADEIARALLERRAS